MKFLTVFLVLLATAASYPVVKTWTLSELSEAIETSKADASLMPYLEDALNEIMLALFTGHNAKFVQAVVPSPTGGTTWTLAQLTSALKDPATRPEHRPALMQAYGYVINNNSTGTLEESVQVAIPALDISTWSQADLHDAIASSDTKAELRPYLEKAVSELKKSLSAGEKRDIIHIITPVGLVPAMEPAESDRVLLPKPTKRFIKKYYKGL